MLGLLLLYFIGRKFYDLAGEFEKSKWGFALLGIASYYIGSFIGQFIIAFIAAASGNYFLEDQSNIVLGLMGLPFGLLLCWGTYKLLENSWNKNAVRTDEDILDSGLI